MSREVREFSEWVFGTGPGNAELMLVGEALGKQEEERRLPFVGPSGELVTDLLEVAGINRPQVYITNVVKIRPPQNQLEYLDLIHNPQTDKGYKVEDFLPLLFNEINTLQPNCILAIGSLACKVLTGKEGIKNWRGSILPCVGANTNIKTIPTIHPAALFERKRNDRSGQGMFTWKQKAHIQFDFIKAARECKTKEWDIPNRNIEIIRRARQLEIFLNTYKGYNGPVYVDCEVYKAHLVCIGFAFTRYHGCSIPLLDLQSNENHKGIPLHELVDLWKMVAEVLADSNIKKGGQNFKADKVYWLEKAGFEVNGFDRDGMFMMHTLSPELPKSLAFQTSIYTNQPFYKNDGKEYNPHKDNIDNLLRYNGMDCVINCECMEEMAKDLKELGLEEFYQEFVMKAYPIYEKMEKKGVLVDQKKKDALTAHYTIELDKVMRKRLDLLAEFNIIPDTKNGDINYNSTDQVHSLIYGHLRCPKRADTSDETLTALKNNVVKDVRKKEIIQSVLDSRSIYKLRGVYTQFKVDFDGRARCTTKQVGAETGRTADEIIKKPLRNGKWGVPFKTVPRLEEFGGNCKTMFIPDPGMVFFERDQSQAEARIIALLAEDYDLLELFDVQDVHRITAAFCYGMTTLGGSELIKAALNQHHGIVDPNIPYADFSFLDLVTEEQRQIGKRSRHGLGFGLGAEGLAIKMHISLWKAKQAFAKVHEMSPKIQEVCHGEVQRILAEDNKVMWTPFRRRREFFEKWGNELFREAYAHIPQSTVGDNTKRAMITLAIVDWIEMLIESHDAFLAQIPVLKVEECYWLSKEAFEQPIDFEKCSIPRKPLIIPTDAKIGFNWGEMEKLKEKNGKLIVPLKDGAISWQEFIERHKEQQGVN